MFVLIFAATAVLAQPAETKKDKEPSVLVLMETSKGDIVLDLNREKAPISVANFLNYTDKGYYDGTIFHRVIGTFMIQGGGFTPDMTKKNTDAPIENEWQNGLKNERGTIAMARQGGRANSATSQFFINVANNASLDVPRDGSGYAVFGKVVAGMNVVDEIRKVKTAKVNGRGDVPVTPVVINHMTRFDEKTQAETLHKAVTRGYVNEVKDLMKMGVDPNLKNDKGETALAVASALGYKDIEQVLEGAGGTK